MFIRTLTVLVMSAALGLLAFGASPASATTNIRVDPGGGIVGNGATFTSSGTFTIRTIFGHIHCGWRIHLRVGTSGGASVDGTLTSLIADSCTDSYPVFNFDTCNGASSLPTADIVSSAGGGTVTLTDTFLFCHLAGGGAHTGCYFTAASPVGEFTNSNSRLTFGDTNISYSTPMGATGGLGSGSCGATGTFNGTFSHLHTASGGTATVTS